MSRRQTADGRQGLGSGGGGGSAEGSGGGGGLGALEQALGEQPGARAALLAALRAGPSHAYAFVGPSGSGKVGAARAFAAELLAIGAADPDDARRRALADPSPHPDLAWITPPGNQHLVDELRERVIGAVFYRPFEGARRVFVIEAADAMAEESQNALLKTLEEPPHYAHLILITSEPGALLETISSRCQAVRFAPLPAAALERRLAAELPGASPQTRAALAALAGGDLGRARELAKPTGERLRAAAERCARAIRSGEVGERPWRDLLAIAAEAGKQRAARVEEATAERVSEFGKGRDGTRARREGAEAAKRAERAGRTKSIDLALALIGAWLLDLIAVAEGASELVRNRDRAEALATDAAGIDPVAARRAAELAIETRRRLQVNVNEELALEALVLRGAKLLGERPAVL